jgi:tRNA threonylcarbamoyladenosine biosynthesis protein TsaE
MTEPELVEWGRTLGASLAAPVLITISGDLGAGKTTLARAVCEGFGVAGEVTSPTFTLVHRYDGAPAPVYHLDLYRLRSPSELLEIGFDDLLGEAAVVVVEWPERGGDRIPPDHIPLTLEHVPGDPGRRLLYAGGNVGSEAFGGQEA